MVLLCPLPNSGNLLQFLTSSCNTYNSILKGFWRGGYCSCCLCSLVEQTAFRCQPLSYTSVVPVPRLPQAPSYLRWYCLEAYFDWKNEHFNKSYCCGVGYTGMLSLRTLALETKITLWIKRQRKVLFKVLNWMNWDSIVQKGDVHCSLVRKEFYYTGKIVFGQAEFRFWLKEKKVPFNLGRENRVKNEKKCRIHADLWEGTTETEPLKTDGLN